MNNNVKKLLNNDYNELGYLEKANNNNILNKKLYPGSGNYTKYAKDCFPELQGLAWCCMFVWWCFEHAYNKIMARNLVGEKAAKCSVMKERMLANGCQQVTRPREGDIVFFNTSSGIGHVGIVYSVGPDTFSTIEGNTSRGKDEVIPNGGGVFTRAYKYNNSRINSFIRPRWDLLGAAINDAKDKNKKHNCQIKARNVNIRDGAGTEFRVLGMQSYPFTFNKIGEKKDGSGKIWYNFMYNGHSAYIRSDFVINI